MENKETYSNYIKRVLEIDEVKDENTLERNICIWNKFLEITGHTSYQVLDVGARDGQFIEWLQGNLPTSCFFAIGVDILPDFIRYATERGRNVIYSDACNLNFMDNTFDVVYSQQLLDLVSDNFKVLSEMVRVSRKYIVASFGCPGDEKKHYSSIKDENEIQQWVNMLKCKIIYFSIVPCSGIHLLIMEKIDEKLEGY